MRCESLNSLSNYLPIHSTVLSSCASPCARLENFATMPVNSYGLRPQNVLLYKPGAVWHSRFKWWTLLWSKSYTTRLEKAALLLALCSYIAVLVFLSCRWMRSRPKTESYFPWRKNWKHRQAMCRSCSCRRKLWMNSFSWWRRQSVTWAVPRERSQEGLEMVRSTAAALYAGFSIPYKTQTWLFLLINCFLRSWGKHYHYYLLWKS